MEKSEKRRCKHLSAHPNSLIAKYKNDGDDNWRKYRQERDPSLCHDRSERRQSNPPIDTSTGYHCSTDPHRPRKHHEVPIASRTKYVVSSVPEESYSKNHRLLRALRNQFYPDNVAVVRKARYKDEPDEDEESKYVDAELAGDDNVEEETGEEVVDEEHENASEYSDKDYEEQEADDEVDEESDILERQVNRLRTQRKNRMEPSLRVQRTNSVEPSHHHRGQKTGAGKDPERCCHTAAERDIVEVQTEEEEEEQDLRAATRYTSKKSPWRYQLSHQDRETRNQPRNLLERYSNFNKTSSGEARRTRRPRTTKPEVESSMTLTRVPHESIQNNRCSHCGVSTGRTSKTTSSRNASCRLQDDRYFTRAPIGDEGEGFEDPEPVISYQAKPRRSKELRSPTYDPREEARTMDAELGAIYKSCRSKNPREYSNGAGERTRHSVRASNRHDPTTSSKNGNRYWYS